MKRVRRIDWLITAIGLTLVSVISGSGMVATWNQYDGNYRGEFSFLTVFSLGLALYSWYQCIRNKPREIRRPGRWGCLFSGILNIVLVAVWGFLCLQKWHDRNHWEKLFNLSLALLNGVIWGVRAAQDLYRFVNYEMLYGGMENE